MKGVSEFKVGLFGGDEVVLEKISEHKKVDSAICGAILPSATKKKTKKAKAKAKEPSAGAATKPVADGGSKTKTAKAKAKVVRAKAKKAKRDTQEAKAAPGATPAKGESSNVGN